MRFFKGPLGPQSEIGRVVVAVLVAVLATIALLAWTPVHPTEGRAAKARPISDRAPGRSS